MRWGFLRLFAGCLALLGVMGCAAQSRTGKPDWQNPNHKRVGEQVVPLLRGAGRSPGACNVFFIESEKLNAVSLGECRFGFTTGLVDTGDARFIRGVAAHEVAHDVLGHADKRKAAIATEQAIRTGVSLIPGIGGLIASGVVLVAGMFALPAYSRSQEAEADDKAVDLLRGANDPSPAGTMAYSFRLLIAKAGAKGGGLLDSHPNTAERLEAMTKREAAEPVAQAPSVAANHQQSDAATETTSTAAQASTAPIQRRGKDDAAMVLVPAGEFVMGDTTGGFGEFPAHLIRVDAFWLDRTEVTNAQFVQFIQTSGSAPQGRWERPASEKENHPVTSITWHDAAAYCKWAGKRLPTEAEWEFAARGTDNRRYPWGNEWQTGRANNGSASMPVGSFPSDASPFGALDLAGNVREWSSSRHMPYPYSTAEGREDSTGPGPRVVRGGAWADSPWTLRATHRVGTDPTVQGSDIGFRCAQSL